jgi:23S rRNA pseudouridine2605 synthase
MSPPQKEKRNRIAKVIARSGLCSRREAERWIIDGRVQVNHQTIDVPGFVVDTQASIFVDGKLLPPLKSLLVWLYYKPKGLITTSLDPQRRQTIFDHLPTNLPRLITVGRLDIKSEGLLLLTNDGEFARFMELPSTGIKRTYRVRVSGKITTESLEKLKKGVTVRGIRYRPIEAIIEGKQRENTLVILTLKEGKKREIRRLMSYLGYPVNRLIRISYGAFQLGNLKTGEIKRVETALLQKTFKEFFY